jgi:hypothetical protein
LTQLEEKHCSWPAGALEIVVIQRAGRMPPSLFRKRKEPLNACFREGIERKPHFSEEIEISIGPMPPSYFRKRKWAAFHALLHGIFWVADLPFCSYSRLSRILCSAEVRVASGAT